MKHEQDSREISQGRQTITRRSFLKIGCGAGAVLAATEAPFIGQERASATEIEGSKINRRQERVFQMRRDAARAYLLEHLEPELTNGDEERYGDKRASSVGLPTRPEAKSKTRICQLVSIHLQQPRTRGICAP
jgi:hypothetical protein